MLINYFGAGSLKIAKGTPFAFWQKCGFSVIFTNSQQSPPPFAKKCGISKGYPFAFWQKMWIFGHFHQFSAKGPPFAKKCEISKGYPLCILAKKYE